MATITGGGRSVKVSTAHVENGQIARTGDLVSLPGGDENASFASLLDVDGNQPGGILPVDGSRRNQDSKSKGKGSHEKQPPSLGDSGISVTSNPPSLQTPLGDGRAPWRLESIDSGIKMPQKDEPSLKSPAEAANGKLSLHMRSVSNVGSLDAPEPNRQRVHEENAVETTHLPQS